MRSIPQDARLSNVRNCQRSDPRRFNQERTLASRLNSSDGPRWKRCDQLRIAALLAFSVSMVPGRVRYLLIARDNDPAGIRASRKLAERAGECGITVTILQPVLKDFNTDLRLLGRDVLAATIQRQWRGLMAT